MKKIIFICMSIFLISISSNICLAGLTQDDPELISLDLKGMDIRDVLKLLAQKSGLNIVADTNVKGTVTVYIKDVSIMDALDIIVSTNNLAYEENGALIRVMNERDYEMIYGKRFNDKTRTDIVKLNYANAPEIGNAVSQIKTNIGKVITDDVSNTIVIIDSPANIDKMKRLISEMDVPLVTEVFPLDYAKAESLKDKLEQMLSKGVGSLKFDERTNKLVVKDTQKNLEDIRKVINAFDEKTREVLIDANIVQVTLSDKYSFGIDWLDIAKMGDIKIRGDTNLSTGLSNVTPNTLSIATTGGNYSTILSLLKQYGETTVLSRPRITVIDKQEAKILVGSKEVYVTSEVTTTTGGTYHTTDNVQFVDVGVRLAVTPEINRAGFVTLKIKPEVSSSDATKTVQLKNPDGSTRTVVPFVTTSEAVTTVIVKDGTTIIIGGLMKDTLVDHKERVPFLGDIPLVGKLFSSAGKTKEKTELVILLTPHIIEGDKTGEEVNRYMAGWEKKAEEIKIEKPEEPGLDLSKSFTDRRGTYTPSYSLRSGTAQIEPKKRPGSKWAPLFGADSESAEESRAMERADFSDASKTPYEEYYLTLRQDINDMARRDKNVSGIEGDVELRFTLDNQGFLISGPIVLNNPDLRLVRSAVSCVKNGVPFRSFPKGMKKEEAEFNVVVRYE